MAQSTEHVKIVLHSAVWFTRGIDKETAMETWRDLRALAGYARSGWDGITAWACSRRTRGPISHAVVAWGFRRIRM